METDQTPITVGGAPALPPPAAPRKRAALPLLIAILLALALAEGVLLLRGNPDEEARAEVFQTSRTFLVQLTTYNAETLVARRNAVLKLSTGQFRREYEQLTGSDFLNTLRERQADSKGRVVHLGVTSVDGDDAEAFALVEITTKNKDLPQPRIERRLNELSLVRAKRGWRIASVTI
ncbi:MAG: hypothetical protein ACRDKS_18265, partial [Actinomycetota bacterium]